MYPSLGTPALQGLYTQVKIYLLLLNQKDAQERVLLKTISLLNKRLRCCKPMRSHSASKTLKCNTWLQIYLIILTAPIITLYNSGDNFWAAKFLK